MKENQTEINRMKGKIINQVDSIFQCTLSVQEGDKMDIRFV